MKSIIGLTVNVMFHSLLKRLFLIMNVQIENGETGASVPAPVAPIADSDEENLDIILERLCALSDDDALKEGKAKGSSSFKLATLKKIAKKMGLVTGLAKPEMVTALRNAVKKSIELKALEETKRDGTYFSDKNTIPRLVNLVLRYPDALQRSSALATRQDLQNKEVNGSKVIWVTVAEQFMDGTDSGGIVKMHEEFIKVSINTEIISKNGIFTSKQAYDMFKTLCRAYARVKPRYEASGRHNGKDFLDFCHSSQLDLLYFHLSLECMNNPELTGYCLEGNVLHGGLDTSDGIASDGVLVAKVNKRKDRLSQVQHQQEMLSYMKERNIGDLRSSKITMLKDLNIALSVLSTSWQELDKTMMNLEDDPDLLSNPRKIARLSVYRLKLAENEKETVSVQEELQLLRKPAPEVPNTDANITEDVMNTTNTSECDDSIDLSIPFADDSFVNESSEWEEADTGTGTSSSSSIPILCCCGCKCDATHSSHRCTKTDKRAMAFCLIGEEGYGSASFCQGCAMK